MEFIYKSAPIGDQIVDYDEKNNIVKGYGSYFDNKDSDQDIIRRGAYQKTIQENGNRVKYLYQHDMMQPLGKMNELYEDEKGLGFTASVPKTQLGTDVIELMKAGVITETSDSTSNFNSSSGNATIGVEIDVSTTRGVNPVLYAFSTSRLPVTSISWPCPSNDVVANTAPKATMYFLLVPITLRLFLLFFPLPPQFPLKHFLTASIRPNIDSPDQ